MRSRCDAPLLWRSVGIGVFNFDCFLVSTCTNKDTFQKVEIINTTERMVRKFPMESCCWLLQELNRFAESFKVKFLLDFLFLGVLSSNYCPEIL